MGDSVIEAALAPMHASLVELQARASPTSDLRLSRSSLEDISVHRKLLVQIQPVEVGI